MLIDEQLIGDRRFNPTVVRLGPSLARQAHLSSERFNPTVVRLGLFHPPLGRLPRTLFQSHCGAIRTGTGPKSQQKRSSFNPTVVRLGR